MCLRVLGRISEAQAVVWCLVPQLRERTGLPRELCKWLRNQTCPFLARSGGQGRVQAGCTGLLALPPQKWQKLEGFKTGGENKFQHPLGKQRECSLTSGLSHGAKPLCSLYGSSFSSSYSFHVPSPDQHLLACLQAEFSGRQC